MGAPGECVPSTAGAWVCSVALAWCKTLHAISVAARHTVSAAASGEQTPPAEAACVFVAMSALCHSEAAADTACHPGPTGLQCMPGHTMLSESHVLLRLLLLLVCCHAESPQVGAGWSGPGYTGGCLLVEVSCLIHAAQPQWVSLGSSLQPSRTPTDAGVSY